MVNQLVWVGAFMKGIVTSGHPWNPIPPMNHSLNKQTNKQTNKQSKMNSVNICFILKKNKTKQDTRACSIRPPKASRLQPPWARV